MSEFTLGMNGKLYFSTTLLDSSSGAGAHEWTEATNVRDVNGNFETGEADVTTRANNGWRATAATLREMQLEFEMQWKPADAFFNAVRDAWLANGEIAATALDGADDSSGKQGPAANFSVTNFSRAEPLEEAMTVSVTLKGSSFQQWYTVNGS
jgi:hypothetical protein